MQKNGFHENVSYNSFALSPRNILINSRTFLKLLMSRKHQVAQWLGNEMVLLSTQNIKHVLGEK